MLTLLAHLTLVDPRVSLLNIFDLEDPVKRSLLVQDGKPTVRGVRDDAIRQDVPISHPNPGNLKKKMKTKKTSIPRDRARVVEMTIRFDLG